MGCQYLNGNNINRTISCSPLRLLLTSCLLLLLTIPSCLLFLLTIPYSRYPSSCWFLLHDDPARRVKRPPVGAGGTTQHRMMVECDGDRVSLLQTSQIVDCCVLLPSF